MGGGIQQLETLLPDPAVPGLIPSVPKKISDEKIVDFAEVNQRRWKVDSGLKR